MVILTKERALEPQWWLSLSFWGGYDDDRNSDMGWSLSSAQEWLTETKRLDRVRTREQ